MDVFVMGVGDTKSNNCRYDADNDRDADSPGVPLQKGNGHPIEVERKVEYHIDHKFDGKETEKNCYGGEQTFYHAV
jgi:hypothetical protein